MIFYICASNFLHTKRQIYFITHGTWLKLSYANNFWTKGGKTKILPEQINDIWLIKKFKVAGANITYYLPKNLLKILSGAKNLWTKGQ